VQWKDDATGLPCIAKRNKMGVWCGYVGVSEGHPAHGRGYEDVEVEVHGDLTFADFCQPHDPGYDGEAHAICHVVQDGEDDRVYWLGFDCNHYDDLSPAMDARFGFGEDAMMTYKTLAYAKDQCASLAAQLDTMSYSGT